MAMIESDTQNELLQKFAEMQNKNDMAEVLKELFQDKKIYMITDFTRDEIKLATRIFTIAEIKNIQIWKKGLAFYSQLLLSKNRQSRREILDAIRGYQNQGLLSKLNPFSKKI